MRKSFGAKPWLFPMPVLVIGTYHQDGTPNAMTAGWGTLCDYDKVLLCLDKNHKTVDNLLRRKAFTVSTAVVEQLVQADLVGVTSGHKAPNKVAMAGWTAVPCSVDAPLFPELPLTLECTLDSYDEETELAVGTIVNVSADDSILTGGKPDMAKLRALTYDPVDNRYFVTDTVAGKAFSATAAQ